MKKLALALALLIGSIASAAATCTGPALMHDFPGTSFNMSLATVPDGNCGSNVALPTWAGGTLGAMANYGTSPGAVLVPGVNASVTASALPTGAATSANQATEITSLGTIATNSGTQATAANQTTANTSLSTIATNSALPLPAQSNFTTNIGNVALTDANSNVALNDACATGVKVYTPVNVVTATNVIIAGVSAKKKYICQILLYPGGTVNFAVYQATTSTSCATAATDIFGGHTTGTGFIATQGAGFVAGNGASSVAATNAVNTDICITTSTTVQVSGVVVTVDR